MFLSITATVSCQQLLVVSLVTVGVTHQSLPRRHPTALVAVYTAATMALGKRGEFVAIKTVADFGGQE